MRTIYLYCALLRRLSEHSFCPSVMLSLSPWLFCQLFGWIGEKFKHQTAVFALMAIMAVQGVANLQAQWAIIGEFSNLPQEELLDWIQDNTPPGECSCLLSMPHWKWFSDQYKLFKFRINYNSAQCQESFWFHFKCQYSSSKRVLLKICSDRSTQNLNCFHSYKRVNKSIISFQGQGGKCPCATSGWHFGCFLPSEHGLGDFKGQRGLFDLFEMITVVLFSILLNIHMFNRCTYN